MGESHIMIKEKYLGAAWKPQAASQGKQCLLLNIC